MSNFRHPKNQNTRKADQAVFCVDEDISVAVKGIYPTANFDRSRGKRGHRKWGECCFFICISHVPAALTYSFFFVD